MKLKDYVTRKGKLTTTYEAFNKYLINDKKVRSSVNKIAKDYAGMTLSELLTLSEFQYMRALSQNKEAILFDDELEEVGTIYTLRDGKVISVSDFGSEGDTIEANKSDTTIILGCNPYSLYTQIFSEKGVGGFISNNDHISEDGVSISTRRESQGKLITETFMLEASSDNDAPNIVKVRDVEPIYGREI